MGHFRVRGIVASLVLACLLLAFGAITASAGGGAPTVETEHETGLGRTSAVLHATVDPNSSPVGECYFEYGTSEGSLSQQAPCSYSPGEGETPVPVEAGLGGLAETTVYYFRIHATSPEGESSGAIRHFTTFPAAPAANTEAPAAVGGTTATLRGFVTPDGAEVSECFFEYGTVPSELTGRVECSSSPGSGGEPVEVRGPVSGLSESTVYYYRVVAKNSIGREAGGRTNFETLPSRPHANTEPANGITHTAATLRGFVTPNGLPVESCVFQWGAGSVEEHTLPCEATELGAGDSPVAVGASLTGLAESTTYKFRLLASNSRGTDIGGTGTFATLPYLAKTSIQRPVELTDVSATLRARVDPQGGTVTGCRFEYGTTPALGKTASCASLPGGGEKYVPVSATISGLSPTTAYLVRLRVLDAFGATYTRTEAFTTFEAGLLPVVSKLKSKKGSSAGGNAVTIEGKNLQDAIAVRFGETEATAITSDTPESVTVTAPAGVGIVDVVVTTPSGESALVGADHYTYGKPIITGLSPGHGPQSGGTEVTVTGDGFEPGISGTTFLFGKAQATVVECATSSTCTVIAPAVGGRPGAVKVKARVNGKSSAVAPAATFTYEA